MHFAIILILIAQLFYLSPTKAAENNKEELVTRLSQLAQQGQAEAQYHLGMMYNNGIIVKADPQQAFQLFSQSAAQGHALASYKLGCYYHGQFKGVVPVDTNLALKYKLVAAEAGYELAQFDVGTHYFQSNDIIKALWWWEKSALQGYDLATARLAYHHMHFSKEPIKAYAMLLILREISTKTNAPVEQAITKLETELSDDDKATAQKQKQAWQITPTALSIKAKMGFREVERLLGERG